VGMELDRPENPVGVDRDRAVEGWGGTDWGPEGTVSVRIVERKYHTSVGCRVIRSSARSVGLR